MTKTAMSACVAVTVASAAAILAGTSPAHACSVALPPHTLDPGEQAVDDQPPSSPTVVSIEVLRTANNGAGCAEGSSCDDLGAVRLALAASDDRTPASLLGYR